LLDQPLASFVIYDNLADMWLIPRDYLEIDKKKKPSVFESRGL
jgi:hypothetical protein